MRLGQLKDPAAVSATPCWRLGHVEAMAMTILARQLVVRLSRLSSNLAIARIPDCDRDNHGRVLLLIAASFLVRLWTRNEEQGVFKTTSHAQDAHETPQLAASGQRQGSCLISHADGCDNGAFRPRHPAMQGAWIM